VKFQEGIELWRRYRLRGWKYSTALCINKRIGQTLGVFGPLELPTIGVSECERYVQTMDDRGLSASTINCQRILLNQFFKYARLHAWMPRDVDPLATWPMRKSRAPGDWKQTATAAEEEKLLAFLDAETRAFVLTALYTGLRRGAVAALRWGWFAHDMAFVTVPAEYMKSGREHRVPLAGKVVEALSALGRPWEDRVFNPHVGLETWSMRFKRAVRALGLNPKLKLHDLRRTFGTRLAEKGVPVPTIQRLGDWSTASIFYRDYLARLGDDAGRDAIGKL
jgi:integrase